MVNPMGPGFDLFLSPRPATGPVPSESEAAPPKDTVGSAPVDPYQRLAQMRKQGLGATAMGPLVAQQVPLQSPMAPAPPPPVSSQPAAEAPPHVSPRPTAEAPVSLPPAAKAPPHVSPAPPAEAHVSPQPAAEAPPHVSPAPPAEAPPASTRPRAVREPVSEDMRQMLEDMRRNGVSIPEPSAVETSPVASSQPAVEESARSHRPVDARPEKEAPVTTPPRGLKEPVSEDMRQMLEDMRRNGVAIPEPAVADSEPQPRARPEPISEDQSHTGQNGVSSAEPTAAEAAAQAPTDAWTQLEEMRRQGFGSTPVSGFAAQQLGMVQETPAAPPASVPLQADGQAAPRADVPPQPEAQAPPQAAVPPQPEAQVPPQAAVPTQPEPQTPPQAAVPPRPEGADESTAAKRPRKEPIGGDMAQMLEDMRNAGVLPPEEEAPAPAPTPSDNPPPSAPAQPPRDPWSRMQEMRDQGLGATAAGTYARQQIDLEQFDREHPKPPPADFKVAPPPQPEPVIAPGGQNRVFDDFQLPPPPPPKTDWWGNWGNFQPGTQPSQPQQPPAQQPASAFGPSPSPGAGGPASGSAQSGPQATTPGQQPPLSQDGWWGTWGDFGSATAPPASSPAAGGGAAPSPPPPAGDAWWGRWGDFRPNPAASPAPGQPYRQSAYYDPRPQMDPRFFDPRSAGYYQPQPVQFPYQPHPGNMPPMAGGGIDPMALMAMPSPGQMLSPMFSPMLSMLPMISMVPMMSMMMMPLMTLPFMFGGFGF